MMRKLFIDFAPLFVFAPSSLVVGLWAYQQFNLLALNENRPLLFFYFLLALSPLFLLLFRPRQELGYEILETIEKLKSRFLAQKWSYLLIGISFSIFYLYAASLHISTYYERDRWILSNELPALPIDMVLPPRFALVANWFVPIDIAVPLVNLALILIWLAFLIYSNSGEGSPWEIVVLIFISTFFTGLFHTTQYATFEFPSAALSFVGIYGIWRRKFSIGLVFLVFGSIFKNTGIFHLATGGVMFLYICWQEKSIKKVLEKLDPALTIFLAFYFIANHWGQFYYIFIMKGGPQYLVEPDVNNIFWLSTFTTFVEALYREYMFIFALGLFGSVFINKEKRSLALFTLGILMFLRSFSKWADEGYATAFVPALSFFSLFGFAYIWRLLKPFHANRLVAIFLLSFNIYIFYGVLHNVPGGMNRQNSNFDGFIRKLAVRFPETGRVYERDISLRPYLKDRLGGDLDGIEFRLYPDIKEEFIQELSQPGCKLIVAMRRHLAVVGVTETEFTSMGYSEKPYDLLDDSGTWVAYSKECNAWEYD